MYLTNGRVYEGNFLNDLFQGLGKIHYPDGSIFEGNFVQGQVPSVGKFINSMDSSIYLGQLRDLSKEGYGKLATSDGLIYTGQFKNNEKHGLG